MSKSINFSLFEEIITGYNGQTAITTFTGSIKQFRIFTNFEFALHTEGIGYFIGSADEEELDVEIVKDMIEKFDWIEPDEILSSISNPEIYIYFDNGDMLNITFIQGGNE